MLFKEDTKSSDESEIAKDCRDGEFFLVDRDFETEQMSCIVKVSVVMGCLSSVLLGFDIGVMSGAAIFIRERFQLSSVQTEVLVGILNLVASVGAVFGGSIADRLGRKKTMAIGSVLFLIGSLIMVLAEDYGVLLFGRIVTGVSIGVGLLIAPLYSAEIAPARYRGFLVSASEIFITFGVLLGYVVNAIFQDFDNSTNWRLMLSMGFVPALFIQLSLCFIPESPRWLSSQDREQESLEVLTKIYRGNREIAGTVQR
jgi:MFS family permease